VIVSIGSLNEDDTLVTVKFGPDFTKDEYDMGENVVAVEIDCGDDWTAATALSKCEARVLAQALLLAAGD
jgi:hypothetical protein